MVSSAALLEFREVLKPLPCRFILTNLGQWGRMKSAFWTNRALRMKRDFLTVKT